LRTYQNNNDNNNKIIKYSGGSAAWLPIWSQAATGTCNEPIYNPCLSSFLFSTILHHSLHCPTLPYPALPYPALGP
jgi:hypothetical protein